MGRYFVLAAMTVALAAMVQESFGLSEKLHRPKIFWPRNYDTNKAEHINRVLNSRDFRYLDGVTSYWEPKWSTTLVYDGDAQVLSAFIAALSEIKGIEVRLTFSQDLTREGRGSLRTGSWWVQYEHTMPDTITVRVNLAADALGGDKFELKLPKNKS
jgi:hypothetical protein